MQTNFSLVNDKTDLMTLFSSWLRCSFYFTHAEVSIIDKRTKTTVPFYYHDNRVKRELNQSRSLCKSDFNADDPFVARLLKTEEPVSFLLDELIRMPGVPAFIQANYKLGIRKVMLTKLFDKVDALGYVSICSDRTDSFPDNFKQMMSQMAPKLASAIANRRLGELAVNDRMPPSRREIVMRNRFTESDKHAGVSPFPEIIGNGMAMRKVYHMVSLVAGSNSTVLLLGETGTGKELIARAIHDSSARKNKTMIKVNCAALPANLIESELFGHERGAFTGALERRIGKFELANHSTLFLDEIGEMPLELQAKLLRAIQEREIERLGGKTPIKVDVRIVVATNRDLLEEVQAGRFRADLYYRLHVVPITLPTLKERPEDIVPLAHFFLARYSKGSVKQVTSISSMVIRELQAYSWPGNVRELEHVIERSVLFAEGEELCDIQLPRQIEESTSLSVAAGQGLKQNERAYIIEVLRKCNGRIAGDRGAAAVLTIPPTTLHSKIKKLGITKADYYGDQQEAKHASHHVVMEQPFSGFGYKRVVNC